jgi:phosphotransferase system enzyme I (PtsP)
MDLADGTPVLLDADVGNLYVRPGQEVLSRFEARDLAGEALAFDPGMLRRPAATSDGTRINLAININLLSDVSRVGQAQYDGVGLYRTEFPFMIRSTFPSEEEQFVIYRKLINDVKGLPVTFRTLDIGGDKVLSYYQGVREENPFLGMRSIRFSLRHPDIFRQQIRAILRAGHESPLRLMFPMISSLDELRESREMVSRCIDELSAEGIEFNREPLIGIMVEIPSVIPIIRELAAESGFFSVGTNDLIQYTLAVDRTNEKVADMYVPHHPAILRSLKAIADAAIEAGIEASVCGDMAIEPRYIPFLLGIGMRSLSIDPQYMPAIKKAIAAIAIDDARALAEAMLDAPSLRDVESFLEKAGTA